MREQRRPTAAGTHEPFSCGLCHPAAHPREPLTGPPVHICTRGRASPCERDRVEVAHTVSRVGESSASGGERQKNKGGGKGKKNRWRPVSTWWARGRSCDNISGPCGKARLCAKLPPPSSFTAGIDLRWKWPDRSEPRLLLSAESSSHRRPHK